MTWIVSGPAQAAIGQNLMQPGSTVTAFDGLRQSVEFAERSFGPDIARALSLAISRATARWEGQSDDGAVPLRPAREDEVDLPPSLAEDGSLDIDGVFAVVEPIFLAVAVPPGVEEVELTFLDDGQSVAFPGDHVSSPFGWRMSRDGDTYVMVDAFIGGGTYRVAGLQRVVDGFARVRLRLRGGVTSFIATVMRVPAAARAAGNRDISWQARLNKAEKKHKAASEKYPRIDCPLTIPHGQIAVFVHGTMATCLPALADAGHHAQLPTYRFEHDTMRPIAENAEQLVARLIDGGSPEVKFVGHSRGGLVALLAGTMYSKTKMVTTFGTPHAGTPLASAMDGLLAYGTVAAGIGAGSVLAGGLTASILGSSLPGGRLPDGWTDMEPHSSFIRMLPHLKVPAANAYGGTFNTSSDLGEGPLFAVDTALKFFRSPNDLVVPLASSCPPHIPSAVVDQVHHFEYFSKDDLNLWAALQMALS